MFDRLSTLPGAFLLASAIACCVGFGCGADPNDSSLDDGEEYEELAEPSLDEKEDSTSKKAVIKGTLQPGQTIDSAFDTSKYHGYTFQARKGSKLSFTLTGDIASTDTALYVYGPKSDTGFVGSPLGKDDNGFQAGSKFSKLSGLEIAEDGDYLVVATLRNTKYAGKAYHLSLACDSGDCAGGSAQQAKWTTLVYGSYDTHDDGGIPSSLGDMKMKVSADSPLVNLLYLEDLPGAGGTKLYKVTPRKATVIKDLGELHLGKPETLTDILKFVRSQYPSTYFMLDLIGHTNTGVSAFLPDYTPPAPNWNGERMMYWQVREAIQKGGGKVDVLALSGCGTGDLEIATRMADVADYVVGLQEYNTGYTDVRWADSLVRNPAITPRGLSWRVADGIFANGYLQHGQPSAVGAYDSSKAPAVKSAFKVLLSAMNAALPAKANEFVAAKKATQTMISENFGAFIDAGDFADQVAAASSDADLKAKAKALKTALDDMMVAGGPSKYADEENHPRANGINLVFMTPGLTGRLVDPSDFDELSAWPVNETSYYEEIGWRAFVTALYPKL